MADDPQPFVVPKKRKRQAGNGSKYRKKSGAYATPTGFAPSGSGDVRESVLKAAEVFLVQARKNAMRFSTRIAPATHVTGLGEHQAMLVTDGTAAPNAAPFEFGERHPLYGNRRHWYKQRTRAYMSRAASNKTAISKAADIYAEAEKTLLAEEYGYTK